MHPDKIRNICNLSCEDRYGYFIRKVADFEEVWLIKGEGKYVTLGDNAGNRIIPVWPEKGFAELMIADTWKEFEIEQKPLSDFMQWFEQLQRDNMKIAVFPTADFNTVVTTPEEMREHLLEELRQYE
ncbi:MAG TPA: DUF2750 domain-containing protein [Flavisolibacter sp.]|nr:DUF2750 domain-containing protein [Flavisolibacter sp.]